MCETISKMSRRYGSRCGSSGVGASVEVEMPRGGSVLLALILSSVGGALHSAGGNVMHL